MSHLIFVSPRKYVQGRGALEALGVHLSALGKRAFVISDSLVWSIVSGPLEKGLAETGPEYVYQEFGGEASVEEIDRLTALAGSQEVDVIVGVGGGKTLDTAKAIAHDMRLPVAVVPTSASTDAPCAALSVIYTPQGVFDSYRFYPHSPDLVLIDTQVCANAPARLFASGIADGLATYLEAQAVLRSNSQSMLAGRPSIAGLAIARACEETLLTHGYGAFKAVEQKLVTPAVEAVVEANTLLSGLGFQNAGLAGAHAIHNGFTAVKGDIHHLTHGEKVTYGILTQMVLEQRSDQELERYIRFFRSIGMPTTLADMHLHNESWDNLLAIGRLAGAEGDTLRNLDARLEAEDVAYAILAVDRLSKALVG